jgi:type IV secretory pathway TraG/TraD family ATPase VirD4
MTGPKQTSAAQVQRRWGFAFALLVVVAGPWMLTSVGLASAVAGGGWVWPTANDLGATLVHLVSNPSRPAAAYPPVDAARVASAAAVCIAAVALLMPIAALAYGRAYWRAGRRGKAARRMEGQLEAERSGSSAWSSAADVADLTGSIVRRAWSAGEFAGKEIICGRGESLAVMAPTGAGKTTRVVVGNFLRMAHAGVPRVLATIKLDAVTLTWRAAERAGPVWLFSPGRESCRWPILQQCATFGGARTVARWLSQSQRVETVGSENMRFWDELGKKLLAPMLYAAAGNQLSMSEVVAWVEDADEYNVAEYLTQLPAGRDRDDAQRMWRATCGRETRMKSSVFGTAEVILSGFDHPDLRNVLAGQPSDTDAYTPGKLIDSRGTLYVAATKEKIDEFGAVFDALMAQLLAEISDRSAANSGLPIPSGIALMLEEAGNIGRIRNFPYVASAMRGMGALLMSVWQDRDQIEMAYDRAAAKSIFQNHSWKMWLPGIDDPDELADLSRRIGTYVREDVSQSVSERDGGGSTTSRIDTAAAAATRRDLSLMGPDEAILIGRSRKAIRLTTTPYYADPALRAEIGEDVVRHFDAALGSQT